MDDEVREFVELHMEPSGVGFFLRDAYLLYREWCAFRKTAPMGRMRFATRLETFFPRGDRVNMVKFDEGGFKEGSVGRYPKVPSTKEQVREVREREKVHRREVRLLREKYSNSSNSSNPPTRSRYIKKLLSS